MARAGAFTAIIAGNGKQGYQTKSDDFLTWDQKVYIRRRNIINVVEPGEEEVEYGHKNAELSIAKA